MASRADISAAQAKAIERALDEIQHLHTLRGEEYVAEAKRIGLLVSERGTRLDLDDPVNQEPMDLDTAEEMIRRLFARHGVDWNPDESAVASH